jgi:hypothetical protein
MKSATLLSMQFDVDAILNNSSSSLTHSPVIVFSLAKVAAYFIATSCSANVGLEMI